MRRIAIDSGVTTPVLYDHFPSKRALYLHLLEQEANALVEVTASIPSRASVPETVATAVEAFFEFVHQRPHAWRLLMREVPADPEIAERHRELQQRGDRAIAEALTRSPSPGRRDSDDDPLQEAQAVAIRAMVNALASWWWDHPDVSQSDMVAVAVNMLARGVEDPSGTL